MFNIRKQKLNLKVSLYALYILYAARLRKTVVVFCFVCDSIEDILFSALQRIAENCLNRTNQNRLCKVWSVSSNNTRVLHTCSFLARPPHWQHRLFVQIQFLRIKEYFFGDVYMLNRFLFCIRRKIRASDILGIA